MTEIATNNHMEYTAHMTIAFKIPTTVPTAIYIKIPTSVHSLHEKIVSGPKLLNFGVEGRSAG